jgi:hypothetical protein
MNMRIYAALLCGYALCGCAGIVRSTPESRLSEAFAGILGVRPDQVEVTEIESKGNKTYFTATTSKGVYNCATDNAPFITLDPSRIRRSCTKIK